MVQDYLCHEINRVGCLPFRGDLHDQISTPRQVHEEGGGITFRFAGTKRDFIGAYSLLYNQYVKMGYTRSCESKMRYLLHYVLQHTRTIIACEGEQVVGCVTVVPDSDFGLPMDNDYLSEINVLRKQHHRIGEVSGLAIASTDNKGFASVLMSLIICVASLARDCGLEKICFAVNPKHINFYVKGLSADLLGNDVKKYSGANNAPSCALSLYVSELCRLIGGEKKNLVSGAMKKCLQDYSSINKIFFNSEYNKKIIKSSGMTEQCLEYFFYHKFNLFKEVDAGKLIPLVKNDENLSNVLYPLYLYQKSDGKGGGMSYEDEAIAELSGYDHSFYRSVVVDS